MDLRTGQIFDSREQALAAGVPESDLMPVRQLADGRIIMDRDRVVRHFGGIPGHTPHQGTREMARRARRLAAVRR